MLFILRLWDWETLSPLWSPGKVGSGTGVTEPQETNKPEASQTKQEELVVGSVRVWVKGMSGEERVDSRLSSREMELWQGFGQGPIPSHHILEESRAFRAEVGLQMVRAETRE